MGTGGIIQMHSQIGVWRSFFVFLRRLAPINWTGPSDQLRMWANFGYVLCWRRLLALDKDNRPDVIESLADPYIRGLTKKVKAAMQRDDKGERSNSPDGDAGRTSSTSLQLRTSSFVV